MSGAHLLDLPPMQSSGTPALYKSNATNEPEGAQQSEEQGFFWGRATASF
jgi:hypothetical protein